MKPFVKWAGGKGQLLGDIRRRYPQDLGTKFTKYCEPFVGGGAVLFDVLSYDFDRIYISDTNRELINTYSTIKNNLTALTDVLATLQTEFHPIDTDGRKTYYYARRDEFNDLKINVDATTNIRKAALFIFLNRTCFNGLFRVNAKGLYNVPMGAYKMPLICDEGNLRELSQALQSVEIHWGDYRNSLEFIDDKTFVYIDPPYRPLTATANFTAYNETPFDDSEQIALARFVDDISGRGAKVVVSNSDPKNSDSDDEFFDDLYGAFTIDRVSAKRMINCNGENRGNISELLICNW
ncbi:MAG: DNA adenine methylase [Candidatus Adiutrix sp.]